METILQGLLDLQGVSAALVLDLGGHLAAHRGRAVHDRALCEQVSGNLVKALESVQLQQPDWDAVGAHFSDGRLLLRNLGESAAGHHVLAVIGDATLNASFATVALRVAANKLRKVLAGGSASSASSVAAASSAARASAIGAARSQPLPSDSKVLSSTGVTWSKAAASSSAAVSRVAAADPASMAFLTSCAKELARHVGPIAKVFVQEAVQRVCPDAPFSLAAAAAVIDDLSSQIEDAEDRRRFRAALEKR